MKMMLTKLKTTWEKEVRSWSSIILLYLQCAGLSVETIPRTDYSLFTSSSEDSEANDEATVDPEL